MVEMIVSTTNNDRGEERENFGISATGGGSNTKKVRQRAPRACLSCRDLKVSINLKSYLRNFINVIPLLDQM